MTIIEHCDHKWQALSDWEGDPSVPNGTRHFTYYFCPLCGTEVDDEPEGFEPDYPEPDDLGWEPVEPDYSTPYEGRIYKDNKDG